MGKVSHYTSSGLVVVHEIKELPHIKDIIVDQSLKQIGKVVDIIGPVSNPYITIKPFVEALPEILYFKRSIQKQSRKRKHRSYKK